ncbi:ABC transporter ATP-binding protein [Dyella caseinilytica]|uniref:ABC transporter ATP-binding protein n=1 Tax=Dyella caseinilytica TaxID=1849581 RepID=A0ABX7GS24_9GAMM|nr:ABC transporter ATP-binding protein [Dyella caseinilytica]QRN53084.1 ABC transporter ATP-binding protein [Dyella caseinilytica]GGA11326.1 sugar ABC transporter ATP-binding protein [Dyella caseinilytica]
MTREVLRVEKVGKAYRDYSSEWSRFANWFGFKGHSRHEKWVLRDISFSVKEGEAIGIVGENGAGKSTLLKIITGTSRASEGTVAYFGRIAAILELGMGFNPDLTGRQNVYHSSGLMGFSRQDVDGVIAAIEDFAEIGSYFDEPVRTYSSGMSMRVAFSVATAFRPEVLIVDEALSVGDTYFQHKSFARIREFQKAGTTLLIVSHDKAAVQALCTRAILLEHGRVIRDGEPEAIMDYYNALIADKENNKIRTEVKADGRTQTISGTGEVQVSSIALYNAAGAPVEFVAVGQALHLRVKVSAKVAVPQLVLGYMIKDRTGQQVYGTNTFHTKQVVSDIKSGESIEFLVDFPANLGPGHYSISTALVSTDTHLVNNYEWRDLALTFSVTNLDKPDFVGLAWIPPSIKVLRA